MRALLSPQMRNLRMSLMAQRYVRGKSAQRDLQAKGSSPTDYTTMRTETEGQKCTRTLLHGRFHAIHVTIQSVACQRRVIGLYLANGKRCQQACATSACRAAENYP